MYLEFIRRTTEPWHLVEHWPQEPGIYYAYILWLWVYCMLIFILFSSSFHSFRKCCRHRLISVA